MSEDETKKWLEEFYRKEQEEQRKLLREALTKKTANQPCQNCKSEATTISWR